MKIVIALLLAVVAVGVFMIVGNTQKEEPEGPNFTDFMCQQTGSC